MLPITRVVLFKHGVAYFQRAGKVRGDERIELSFKASQMNDVLKSLTALDFGGGSFAALTYDSEEPLERRLQEISMAIPDRGAIAAFLDGLKGARISLARAGGTLTGAVVGIEVVERAVDGQKVSESHLALLAGEGRLVRVPLLEVEELTFEDEAIRRDLRTLLDILYSGLRRDRKRFSLQARGEGERAVSVSYVVEAPVWKTSYRIMLPAPPREAAGGGESAEKPLLQGWALIDNTTEDDWTGVALSLVAGLPISFVHDLYTPRYRRRPVVRVEEEAAVAPPILEAGEAPEEMAPEPTMDMEVSAPAPMAAARFLGRPAPARSMAKAARASVQVQTRTQEVGDLFAYEIVHPVDVARGRSALVPILQSEIEAERVALYNSEVREKNPMTAVRLTNSTALTLEGGPVTVFEGEAYVGEAMLDTLRAGDQRITPYSVELGVTVKAEVEVERERYTRATKSGQQIEMHYRELRHTRYQATSRLERAVPLYLDHRFSYPLRDGSVEPVEVTDHFWRYRIELKPRAATRFQVTEVADRAEAIYLPGLAVAAIQNLVSHRLISSRVRAALERVAEQAQLIAELEKRVADRREREKKTAADQGRLRENIKALGGSSDEAKLRQKYVASLSGTEDRIEALRGEIEKLTGQLEAERRSLEQMVDALELDER